MTRTIVALCLVFAFAGCVRVKPYQRETLSKRELQASPWPAVERHDVHTHRVREGSNGAVGNAGGGCGCN